MISMEILLHQTPGLERGDVERWIVNAWVKPDGQEGAYVFAEIDVARVRLIRELRDDLLVNEESLPVILLLLDQLYDVRRKMLAVSKILNRIAPDALRGNVQ
jgi:chaperone modulatory protein CbpM